MPDGAPPAEEAAIFAAANAGIPGSDSVDVDSFGFTVASTTIDAGDEVLGTAQLDSAANRVWAILFSVKVQ